MLTMKSHRVRKNTSRRERGWKQLQCCYLHELQSFASCERGEERREGNYKERGCKGEGRANPRIAQTHCTHRYSEHCMLRIAYCTLHIAHCISHIAYCTLHIAHCVLHIAHRTQAHCILHIAYCILHIAHRHIAHCTIGAGTANNALAQVQTQGLRSGFHICFVFVQRHSISILCL